MVIFVIYTRHQNNINKPISPEDEISISFQIKQGESAKTIAEKLESQGVIKSARSFNIYVKRNNLDKNFLTGRFLLNKGMNVPQIIETLSNPAKAETIITIQEGLMIRDIDKKLTEMKLTSEGDFISAIKTFNDWDKYDFLDKSKLSRLEIPLEGYIFPDTYFLNSDNFQPEELIYKALNNFERKWKTVEDQLNEHTIHEIITMASIIETEVFGEEDRKLVSGILWKRLENNWRLDADATLLYIKNDRTITKEDLQSDSPYNTRKKTGLPPGPISNPSIESINASLNPKKSDYWFYLNTKKTGETIFSKTNEEHNINRARYL